MTGTECDQPRKFLHHGWQSCQRTERLGLIGGQRTFTRIQYQRATCRCFSASDTFAKSMTYRRTGTLMVRDTLFVQTPWPTGTHWELRTGRNALAIQNQFSANTMAVLVRLKTRQNTSPSRLNLPLRKICQKVRFEHAYVQSMRQQGSRPTLWCLPSLRFPISKPFTDTVR